MVRQWKLKPKDKLYCEWEVRDSKMVAVVKKHEDRPNQIFKKQQWNTGTNDQCLVVP